MDLLNIQGIYSDPEIHGGQPVVETGVPIYLILDMLAQGFTHDEMLNDYGIIEEHIQLALRFASEYVKKAGTHAA